MSGIKHLQELAEQLFEADQKVARLEEDLAEAKAAVKELAERDIPAAMDSVGMDEIKTRSGLKLKVGRKLSCGKLTNAMALDWLEKNGHAGLIKADVAVGFGRADKDNAVDLLKKLREEGMAARMDEHVHASTIKAFLKAQLEEGEPIDLELFGAFERPVAEIELPKAKKK